MDGDLSDAERAQLEQLLSANESLRREAAELQKVGGWVFACRQSQPQIDWKSHAKLAQAAIDAESDLAGVDHLLSRWGGQVPLYDERALVKGVMARIAPARQAARARWRYVARLGAPLAAAAAIVVALTANWQEPVMPKAVPITEVRVGPVATNSTDDLVVSFAQALVIAPSKAGGNTETIGYMALGAGPISQPQEESPL